MHYLIKRVSYLFLSIVLVIGVGLLYSVFSEVLVIRDRFMALENTVSVAMESTLGVVMGSDELFSERNADAVVSVGVGSDSGRVSALVPLYRNGKLEYFNAYGLSKYYWDNGERLPGNLGDVVVEDVGDYHEWLYGEAGSDYGDGSLAWANRNRSTLEGYSHGDVRSYTDMTDNFSRYIRDVGLSQGTVGYLKENVGGAGSFRLVLREYPVLANMGFLGIHEYNEVTSSVTQDQLTSTYHLGKRNKGYQRTKYYLTPTALGVTYVPVEVLKPVLKANLETVVRLNKVSGGSFRSGSEIQAGLGSADGMVSSQVFEGGSAVPLGLPVVDGMVNDGYVDYDINSLQVKVDYFGIDFGDGSEVNKKVLAGVDGLLSDRVLGGGDRLSEGLFRFLDRDSAKRVESVGGSNFGALFDGVKGQRIVARVSMRVKVYIPYNSSIMQWVSRISGEYGRSHFGVRQWGVGGDLVVGEDGLWYVYTKYIMNSRG